MFATIRATVDAILHHKLINAAASTKRAEWAASLGMIDLKVYLYSVSPMGSSRCSNQPAAAAATRYTNHSVSDNDHS